MDKVKVVYKCLPLVIAFALLMNLTLLGQSKVGTTIGQFLKISPSARATAIGNTSTSLTGEVSASYYNPASLGKIDFISTQFTHNIWLAGINYNYAIIALPISGIGTVSFNLTSLNSGDIDVRTVEKPLGTGERYSVSNFALGVGYGLALTDRVSVGLHVNYIQESIWHSSIVTFGLNFGVLYQIPSNGFTLGASISNFGPRAKYSGRDLFINHDFNPAKHGDNDRLPGELRTDKYGLPTMFRVGMSYPLKFSENNKLLISVDAVHPNDNDESLNVGAEWEFMNYFNLRGGYRDLFLKDSEGGLVFGAGVNVSFFNDYNISFDYAWADYGRLEQAHRFTLGIRF